MSELFLGVKNFILGATALITATVSTGINAIKQAETTPTPSPVIVNQQDIVTRSGEYSHSGQTLKYTLNIPKSGGDITGNFDGVCKGPISGKYVGKEGGSVSGDAQTICKVAIFSYDLKAKYNGKLFLKEGKVDLNWEGQIPYTSNSGSFTIFFEPFN